MCRLGGRICTHSEKRRVQIRPCPFLTISVTRKALWMMKRFKRILPSSIILFWSNYSVHRMHFTLSFDFTKFVKMLKNSSDCESKWVTSSILHEETCKLIPMVGYSIISHAIFSFSSKDIQILCYLIII